MADQFGIEEPPKGGSPGASGAPGAAPDPNAANLVNLPSTLLMAVAGLGILVDIGWTLLNLLGVAFGAMASQGAADGAANLVSGAMGIVYCLAFVAAGAFIIYGALQMKNLKNWTLALVANILVMIPCCIGPCCLLGLPVGIWGILVLIKPEVKAAFATK